MDGRGSIPGSGKRFSVVHSFQTGSGVHVASYPMSPWVLPPGVKGLGHEANHISLSSAEVKCGGDLPLRPHTSSWRDA
jgi:hypothetical protein